MRKELILSVPWRKRPTETDTFGKLCSKALAALPGKSLVLIVDQFEEYFVAKPAPGTQERFERALAEVSALEHHVRMLFSLRKEFVDDLLDLAKVIPYLQSTRWRMPLRNFPPDTAREVLRKVSQEESLPFSDELQDMVIADLTRDERVRPVEFQIVLTTLLAQGVSELSTYRAMQGTQGVITSFVSDIIEPPDLKVNEVERIVARQTLRALCNPQFTTRRPVGLTRSELLERLLSEVQTSADLAVPRAQIEAALDHVLRRFLESYVLILENRERFNLINDYLASPVRDATAGMETVEERANRMLEQYIEQARADPNVVMPWKTVHLVQRFAGKENLIRTDAASLLRRSRVRHHVLLGGAALAVSVLVTLLLPFGMKYPVEERIELKGARVLSSNGRLLVALDKNQASVVRLDRPKFEPSRLSLSVTKILLSPAGDSLLALATDNALYRVRIEDDLKPERLIGSLGWDSLAAAKSRWVGFSADGSWSFATSADGRVYAWPVQGRPREIFKVAPEPPIAGLNANGRWLWVVDRKGKLYILNPSTGSATPAAVIKLAIDVPECCNVEESATGKWLALADGSGMVRIIRLTGNLPSSPAVALRMPKGRRLDPLDPQLWFSPDEKWLLARQKGDDFYAVQLSEAIAAQTFPAIDLQKHSSWDLRRRVVFDAASKYVAGQAQDGQFYIWQLASPPRANARPPIEKRDWLGIQNVMFCPNNSQVLLSGQGGSLHSARLDRWPLKFKQIGQLAIPFVHLRMANDQETVFAYDSVRLVAGNCDKLRFVTEQQTAIFDIVSDGGGNLVLLGEKDLLRLGRAFYLWGLPVWQMSWPEILRESTNTL